MRIGTVAAMLFVLAGCGGGDDGGSESPGGGFEERLRAGAPCSELFEMRNEFDPDSERIPLMNEQLREVGCFMSSSDRTD